MPSYRITGFQGGGDALTVTLAGRAAPVRVPVARADLVALATKVADAFKRGEPIEVDLDGDELRALDGPTEDLTARPATCALPPGPPLSGFGTYANGDVGVGTGSQRVKILRRARDRFVENVAKLAAVWKRGDRALRTDEVPVDDGTDEIVAICL